MFMLVACARGAAPAVDLGRLADCIAQVETGGSDRAVGAQGERGRFQISPVVWHQHAGAADIAGAHNPIDGRAIALKHLAWMAGLMQRRQIEPSVYRLALGWNAGLSRATRGQPTSRQKDYAQRVANLYAVNDGS